MDKTTKDPIIKIELDAIALASLLDNSADSLKAAARAGMRTILLRSDMTLRDFISFCLGEAGSLDEYNQKKEI